MKQKTCGLIYSIVGCLGLAVWGCGNESDRMDTGGLTLATFSDSGADDGSDDGGERFDVAVSGEFGQTGGDQETDACKKVDLLFVIDNSGSMADEQQNLVASFPGFIDSIQTVLADTKGYHVGVITTDSYLYNEAGCLAEGALVTKTGGPDASNSVCSPYATGARYMSELDDLSTAFSCAAQVGTGGDGNERGMQTLQAAIAPAMNGAGACNDGFLRDDALLVLVIITDEEDDHEVDACLQNALSGSAGEPQQWVDAVVSAKGGVESNVVVLSLVGPEGADQCPLLDKCVTGIDGAEVATRIIEFTEAFTHGFVGQVCAPSYEPFFTEAVSVIKSACDDFMPPS